MILEHYEVTLIGQKRPSKIEFYRTSDIHYGIRWRCLSPSDEILGASSKGFTTIDEAKKNSYMLSVTLGAFKFETNTDGF